MEHQKSSEQDNNEYYVVNSKPYQDLTKRIDNIANKMTDFLEFVLKKGEEFAEHGFLNQKKQQMYLDDADIEQVKKNPEVLLQNLQELVTNIFRISAKASAALISREGNLDGQYDEVLISLEKEVRIGIKSQEKLEIHLECLKKKNQFYQVSLKEYEKVTDQLKEDIQRLQKNSQFQIKSKEQEINTLRKQYEAQTSSKILPRPQTSALGNVQLLQSKIEDSSPNQNLFASTAEKLTGIQTLNSDHFTQLKQSLIRPVDEVTSTQTRVISQKLIQSNKLREIEKQQNSYQVQKLLIKIEEKESENRRLRRQYEEIYKQLKDLKENIQEQEEKRQMQDVNSDKNPNLVSHYKKKLEDKHKEVAQLKKQSKKFAILEKKLLVKEKAFEYERAEAHNQIIGLDERVKGLSRLYETTQSQLKSKLLAYGNYHDSNI